MKGLVKNVSPTLFLRSIYYLELITYNVVLIKLQVLRASR